MRVLLLHKFLYVKGGAEVFVFETARALQNAGHEVAFMSTRDERNIVTPWNRYFPTAPPFRSENALVRGACLPQIVYSRSAKKATRDLVRAFKPDIAHAFNIHTHLSPSVLDACREEGVPVVMTCNDYKHICPNYQLYHHGAICQACAAGSFFPAVRNRCCQDSLAFSLASFVESTAHDVTGVLRRNVHTFLFSSDFMARMTERFWLDTPFHWSKLRNPFHSPSVDASIVKGDYALFVGRFVVEKGADVLIRAAARCPEVPVVLVGDGPEEAALRGLADSLSAKNVTFAGAKWGNDLDALIAKSRFVVVPSVWHENYPYVVVQSFAHGKPVVGSTRGGIPELVRPKMTGVLFDPRSHEELAQELSDLWSQPDACMEMGRAAKRFADEAFTRGAFTAELLDAYRGALS